jgi:hypothetical protein
MNALHDLTSLKRQWQAQSPPVPEVNALRERLAADTRAHWRTLGLVGLGTALVLAATLLYALRSGHPAAWFGFGFTALFALLVWVVAMWLSRGTWSPRDESIAAHLDLSIRRCRSVIIAAPVGILLYAAGLVGSLAWKQRLLGVEWTVLLETPAMIVAGWIGAPLYTFGMLWNAHRQRQRLQLLQQLRRQLSEG